MIAHDVYAETNPAWVIYVLTSFLRGFMEAEPSGTDLPIAYLGLPICLSGDLASTFERTNKKTGLREWVERSPQVHLELSDRINASLPIITDAIRLGCFTHAVIFDGHGRLFPGDLQFKSNLAKGLSPELSMPVKHAERLGYWFGTAGSTKTSFDILGLGL